VEISLSRKNPFPKKGALPEKVPFPKKVQAVEACRHRVRSSGHPFPRKDLAARAYLAPSSGFPFPKEVQTAQVHLVPSSGFPFPKEVQTAQVHLEPMGFDKSSSSEEEVDHRKGSRTGSGKSRPTGSSRRKNLLAGLPRRKRKLMQSTCCRQ
jgi:hypothetical protein